MANAQTYRMTAEAMRKRAQAAGTPEHRAAWALVATKWEALAKEVESFDPPGEDRGGEDRSGGDKADEPQDRA